MSDQAQVARTHYPRLRAPVYFNRLAFPLFRRKPKRFEDRLGGVSVYTDDEPAKGTPLKIEIFLPDGTTVVCRAEVAWVETLPVGAPARCDVGLRFIAIRPGDRERLSSVTENV